MSFIYPIHPTHPVAKVPCSKTQELWLLGPYNCPQSLLHQNSTSANASPAPSRPHHLTLCSALPSQHFPTIRFLLHTSSPGTAPQQGAIAADPAQPCQQKGEICSIPLHPPASQAPLIAPPQGSSHRVCPNSTAQDLEKTLGGFV